MLTGIESYVTQCIRLNFVSKFTRGFNVCLRHPICYNLNSILQSIQMVKGPDDEKRCHRKPLLLSALQNLERVPGVWRKYLKC